MNASRPSSLLTAAAGWALALSWTVPAAFAQQYPSQQRGLSADTAFQVGAIDHVNLFNGGLTLTLPLGPSYPVGPNLSYGLTLSYSSNGWDYEDAVCLDGMVNRYSIPIESPHTNAGFGWRIVPGKILTRNESPFVPAARYVGPDGSERGFYEELHPGYPATPQSNTWFSNDSTYLRLRRYTAGSGVCTTAPGGGRCFQVPTDGLQRLRRTRALPHDDHDRQLHRGRRVARGLHRVQRWQRHVAPRPGREQPTSRQRLRDASAELALGAGDVHPARGHRRGAASCPGSADMLQA
jgi:hypothetical protein